MKNKNYFEISCHNEWCNGPENYKIVDDLPKYGVKCPVCGWLALLGSGIKKLYSQEDHRVELE